MGNVPRWLRQGGYPVDVRNVQYIRHRAGYCLEMKTNLIHLSRFGALPLLVAAAVAGTARAQQPFDTTGWNIHAAESRVESYRGRSALLLRNGAAWLRGSRFRNGTIEFDIAFSDTTGFPGIAFRAGTHDDYELFY